MTIKPGMIGVNTADNESPLYLVAAVNGHCVTIRPFGGTEQDDAYIQAADFWPLISKLNIGE